MQALLCGTDILCGLFCALVSFSVPFPNSCRHTITVGKVHLSEICEEAGIEVPPPEAVVRWIFEFFIANRIDLTRTEGMQGPEVFPANYFSTRTVFNYFDAASADFVDYVKAYHASK